MRSLEEIIKMNEIAQAAYDNRKNEILRKELLTIFQQSDVKLAVAKRIKELKGDGSMQHFLPKSSQSLLPGETEEYQQTLLDQILCYIFMAYVTLPLAIFHFLGWVLAIPDQSIFNEDPVQVRLQKISGIIAGTLYFVAGLFLYRWLSGLF